MSPRDWRQLGALLHTVAAVWAVSWWLAAALNVAANGGPTWWTVAFVGVAIVGSMAAGRGARWAMVRYYARRRM